MRLFIARCCATVTLTYGMAAALREIARVMFGMYVAVLAAMWNVRRADGAGGKT